MYNFITPNKEVHKYIIGIDFGHGETSADICNIQWDDNYFHLDNPTTIEIFNGQKATKSVLLVENGTDINNEPTSTYYVGQQAIERYLNKYRQKGTDRLNQSHFYCYFKQKPSLMEEDGTVEIMKQFMRGIYLQIRKQRSELTDNNHVVYIACPSNARKWTNEELMKYAEIALDAGLPLAKIDDNSIGIIRESRAAFIKARSNPNSKYAIRDGILLIDFGSSTVDLTYYSSQYVQKPEDDGDDCGAYHVEREIYNHLIQDDELARLCSESSKSTGCAMELGIREEKEKFYTYDADELEISLSATKLSNGKVSGRIEKYYSDTEINEMLTSYKSSIEKCFKDYKDQHLSNHPIKLVFLTGGASRMDFIKDIVCKVFNYQGEFYRDTDPSLTISNGIALAGRADMRSSALLEVLLQKIDNNFEQNDIAGKVIESGTMAITEAVLKIVEQKYKDFKDQKSDGSIAMLETNIKNALSDVNYSTLFNKQFEVVLREIVNEFVLNELNSIVADYFPDEKINEISSNYKFSTEVTVSTKNIEMIISKSVESISEGVMLGLLKVLGSIVGGLTAIVLAVFVKIVGEIYDLFSKEEDKVKIQFWDAADEIGSKLMPNWNGKDTILDSNKRGAVFDQFTKNKEQFSSIIKDQLKNDMSLDEKLKDSIVIIFRKEAKNYVVEQISRVRLMLN